MEIKLNEYLRENVSVSGENGIILSVVFYFIYFYVLVGKTLEVRLNYIFLEDIFIFVYMIGVMRF